MTQMVEERINHGNRIIFYVTTDIAIPITGMYVAIHTQIYVCIAKYVYT